jgi:hypothetical protein
VLKVFFKRQLFTKIIVHNRRMMYAKFSHFVGVTFRQFLFVPNSSELMQVLSRNIHGKIKSIYNIFIILKIYDTRHEVNTVFAADAGNQNIIFMGKRNDRTVFFQLPVSDSILELLQSHQDQV